MDASKVEKYAAEMPEEKRLEITMDYYGGITKAEIIKKHGLPLGDRQQELVNRFLFPVPLDIACPACGADVYADPNGMNDKGKCEKGMCAKCGRKVSLKDYWKMAGEEEIFNEIFRDATQDFKKLHYVHNWFARNGRQINFNEAAALVKHHFNTTTEEAVRIAREATCNNKIKEGSRREI